MATSYGRNVKLEADQDSVLDEHPGVQKAFSEAHRAYVHLELEEPEAETKGRGSQMVKDDSASAELTPSYELEGTKEVQRQGFDEKWKDEQANADDYQALLQSYRDNAEDKEAANEQDRGDDLQQSI